MRLLQFMRGVAAAVALVSIFKAWNYYAYPKLAVMTDMEIKRGPNYYGKIITLNVTVFNPLTNNRISVPTYYEQFNPCDPWKYRVCYLTQKDTIYQIGDYIEIIPMLFGCFVIWAIFGLPFLDPSIQPIDYTNANRQQARTRMRGSD